MRSMVEGQMAQASAVSRANLGARSLLPPPPGFT